MNNLKVSSQALKSLAMELGATVENPDGTVFNSSGSKGVLPVARDRKPDHLQQLLTKLVEAAAKPVAPTAVEAPQVHVQVPQQKPCSWKFSFIRNADGTINDIIAKPLKD